MYPDFDNNLGKPVLVLSPLKVANTLLAYDFPS